MRTPILLIIAISLAANGSLGVIAAIIDGGAKTLGGLRDGASIGIGALPVVFVTLIDHRPLLTAPTIVFASWGIAALVTLGPAASDEMGRAVVCVSITMGCIVTSLLVARDREKNPLFACTNCGYDLFGITGPKCPECGTRWSATHQPRGIEDRFPWNLGDLACLTVGITASGILWSGGLCCLAHL